MRDLTVRIRANADEFDAAMRQSGLSARAFSSELRKLEQQEARREQAMRQVGIAMTAFGAAVVGGLGLAAKAAIDWESAWTGVVKVIDGSPEQLVRVEEGLRGLARELPVTHEEIAGVAQAAGQLGVSTDGIVEFTRTMINLGVSTNLSAEEAAFGIARMANVMGTAEGDVDRLGSSLVLLGNNSATTEGDILAMAQRISGAGNQIGLTEGEVLGFAAALSSVGIEAAAGGTSISRAMITISAAVNEGGDSLDQFAEISGMSASEFARAFEEDPARAIEAFVSGLGRISEGGGDVFAALESVGLSEVRVRDAFLRLSGAGDLLADSLALGNRGWEENSALVEEAARVFGTTEARMKIAQGQIQDFAITVGQTFTPIIGAAADKVSNWAALMGELPTPVVQAGAALGGLVGAASLVGGGMLLLLPRIRETMSALDAMGGRGAAAATGLRGLGRFLVGPWGIALGAAAVAAGFFFDRKAEQAALVRDLTTAIEQEGDALSGAAREVVIAQLAHDGLLQTAKDLGINLSDLVDAHLDPTGEAYARVDDHLRGLNDSQIEALGVFGALGTTTENVVPHVSALRESILGTNEATAEAVQNARLNKEALGESGDAAGDLTDVQGDLASAMDDTAEAADDLKASLEELTGGQRDLTSAQIRYLDDVERLTESLSENGGSFDENTDAGRRNLEALLRVTGSSQDLQTAIFDLTGEIGESTNAGEEHRKKLVDIVAQSTGNRDEAARLVDAFLGQAGATDIATDAMGTAEGQADRYKAELGRLRDMSSARLRPEIDNLIRDFGSLGGAHAGAEDQAGLHIQEILRLAREASPELRRELLDLAREIAALPDGEFTVTGRGKVEATTLPGPAGDLARARAVGRAAGGVLPGWTPGRDVHRFHSATGGVLDLSGGEAVMRPEWTRAVGSEWVDAANAAARRGGVDGVAEFISRTAPRRHGEGIAGDGSRFAAGGIIGGQRLAMGGVIRAGVTPFKSMAVQISQELRAGIIAQLAPSIAAQVRAQEEAARAAAAGGGGAASGPVTVSASRALAWGRTQHGKPYIWAGAGPRGYDCSGFLGALVNIMRGRNPHSRIGSTGTFPWPGFRPGIGPGLSIGSFRGNPGHMAGTIGGVNVESRGGAGVLVGPRARGAGHGMFRTRAHLADRGGIFEHGEAALNLSGRAERALTGRQNDNFERLVRILDSPRLATAGTTVVNNYRQYQLTVHNAEGQRVDLETQFARLELRAGV